MTSLTAEQIATASGGTLVAGDGAARADHVSTDSRVADGGCVFVALHGDTFDGHAYLGDVRAKGATVALVDRDVPVPPAGMALVRVDDTRRALGRLAHVVRRSITRPKVIAVAGSNGKTSTKNALHAVLSRTLRGTASPKSFNNDIGVPATLFPVAADDDYVILEIGTNHPGEVEHLSRMSEPDVAVITSIGEEHLEFFGSVDNVRRENAAIAAGLRPGGLLVICGDDDLLGAFVDYDGPVVRFGLKPGNDLVAKNVRVTLDGTHFSLWCGRPAHAPADGRQSVGGTPTPQLAADVDDVFLVPTAGVHFASNALAVIAVARHLGLDDDAIRAGLATADASDMRMQRRVCGDVTLINDAYNANPTSVRAAIDTLQQLDWPGRKVVVMADMKELGDWSAAAHAGIARAVAAAGFDAAYAVGPAWQDVAADAKARWFADSAAAASPIAEALRPGDLVLLKGSRSMKLERVADAIAAKFT